MLRETKFPISTIVLIIAVIDATTSKVLAWVSLKKQLDGNCGWCG